METQHEWINMKHMERAYISNTRCFTYYSTSTDNGDVIVTRHLQGDINNIGTLSACKQVSIIVFLQVHVWLIFEFMSANFIDFLNIMCIFRTLWFPQYS